MKETKNPTKIYNSNLVTLGNFYSKKGGHRSMITTKPFSFRIDESNLHYLELTAANKGRYINDLIHLDRRYDIMALAKYHDLSRIAEL